MYQALYRKYRPKSFSDVSGQEHITETLRRQIVTDRFTHAYLFAGTRGTGKTTCAKILSRAVNCLESTDGNPCNKCASCVGIEDGTILDVLELDAASNNGVDDVRAMRDEAVYTPAYAKKRVYIVDEVHMLSSSAFNALLKILEEPPEHIIFILATTELHKVPATIQSRCQKFSFRRLALEEIIERLKQIASNEGLSLTDDAAEKLALLADGAMRDGVSLLDQCATDKVINLEHVLDTLGLAGQDELFSLAKAVSECDITTALSIIDTLYNSGKDMAALLSGLSGFFRDLLVVYLAPESSLINSGVTRAELSSIAKVFTASRLYYCLEVSKNALLSLSRAGMSKLVLEMCLIRMCDERLSDDLGAIAARVSRLEAGGASEPASQTALPKKYDASQPPAPLQLTPPQPPAPLQPAQAKSPALSEPTEPTQAAAPTNDIIDEILSRLDDFSLRVLLNDKRKVQAKREENLIIINVMDSFGANTIRDMYMDTIKDAVRNAFGSDVLVRVETGQNKTEADKQGKLDNLMQFEIVKFE